MPPRDLLLKLSDLAWDALRESIASLNQDQAWASVQLQPGEYLHTEGSILSQIAHVASCKIMYGSVGFRETEVRWRDLAQKVDLIWPSLDAAVGWLHDAHSYWTESWARVEDLEAERPRFDGSLLPTWKLIATVINHDHYHAGQIQLQRTILPPTSMAPPPEGALWVKYCGNLPSW